MRPQVVADFRRFGPELDVERIAQRVRGVGAHDEGPVARGRAAHGGGGGDRCLADSAFAREEDHSHGRSLRSVYVRGTFLRLPAATSSSTFSCTSVSTCLRIWIVTSVFFSVIPVTSAIALRICTFCMSALSASSAACSSVSRSFCDCRFPASSRTGPV